MINKEPTNPTLASPPLDFGALTGRMNNNPKLAAMLVKKFNETLPSYNSKLPNSVAASNLQQMKEFAHKLKGSASTVAADGIATAATNLEDAVIAENLDEANAVLPALAHEIDRFLKWFQSSPDLITI